jgi:hypothetical protein
LKNKKVLSKLTITIFLAFVLFTGTITAMSSQSLFLAETHAQHYYDGEMYNGYDSYEPPPQYQPDYKPKYP